MKLHLYRIDFNRFQNILFLRFIACPFMSDQHNKPVVYWKVESEIEYNNVHMVFFYKISLHFEN